MLRRFVKLLLGKLFGAENVNGFFNMPLFFSEDVVTLMSLCYCDHLTGEGGGFRAESSWKYKYLKPSKQIRKKL